jgi:predicted transcriptional regulator
MTHCGKIVATEYYRNQKKSREHYSAKNMIKTGHHSTSENEIDKLKHEIDKLKHENHKLKKQLDKRCGEGRHFHPENHLSDEHGCMNDSDM